MPADFAAALGLKIRAASELVLGDGSITVVNVYGGLILWEGQRVEVEINSVGDGLLIGMWLLTGTTLTANIVPGGAVIISDL